MFINYPDFKQPNSQKHAPHSVHLYDQQPVQLYKSNFHQSIQEFQELIQVSKVQLNQQIASKKGFERFFPG